MVDYFALGLTHALLALAAWRLMQRSDLDRDLDRDPAVSEARGDGDA